MSAPPAKRVREVRWTQELTTTLIELWEQNEHLYNSKHEDHLSKLKRTASLEKICIELRKLNNAVSVEGIRKKIHSLCTLYADDYKNWRTNDYYTPKLWCFEQLSFLTRGIGSSRSSKSNIDTMDGDDDSCSNEDISHSSERAATSEKSKNSAKKKKKPSIDELQQVLMLKEFIDKKLNNRYEWLGQQVNYKMNIIKDESIRKETSETIEYILNQNVSKDKSSTQLDSDDHKNYLLTNIFPPKRKKHKPLDPGVNEIQQKILTLNGIINEKVITSNGGLSKLVVDRVSQIEDEEIREETVWAIQCILKENVERDKFLTQHNDDFQVGNNEVVDSTNVQCVDSFISDIWDTVNVDVEV